MNIVADLADGTSKLTIAPKSLKEYYIDYIPYDKQIKFVNTYIKRYTQIEKNINVKRNF